MQVKGKALDEMEARQVFERDDDSVMPTALCAIGPRLLQEFGEAMADRQTTEDRWLQDLRQYRGVYDDAVLAAIGPVRSKAFVRKTRVKIKTIDSRVADLLFPAGTEKNWSIDKTPSPSVSKEQRAGILKRLTAMQAQQAQAMQEQAEQEAQEQGQPAGPMQPLPPISRKEIDEAVDAYCADAADGMSKVIEDQLVESRYKEASLKAVHSGHLYGTGVIKGPLVERRVRTKFVLQGGKWVSRSESYVVPFVEFVPLWRFYPDMSATTIDGCRYVWERHSMTQAALAELAERKSFRAGKALITEHIKANPHGATTERDVDQQLRSIGDRDASSGASRSGYEVLERWGWLSGEELQGAGISVPTDRAHESFFSNVWMLPNGQVIKAVLQPIDGVTWPYHLYSFDDDETSIFSEGIAAIMRDDQTNLNAATRMMLDNAALTAGFMLEVTPTLLSRFDGDSTQVHPHKVWLRNSTSPGSPAVRPIQLPNHLNELRTLAQMFEVNADETTAIPRYMSGENATQGAAGTASGMSMLMGAANIVIKDLVTAWDEGVTRNFLQSLYRWNMKFHPDQSIKGDFDVKARGTASLVAKEVRSRLLADFTASVSNPMDAPYIRRDKLLMQRAEANELSDVVKSQSEVEEEMASGPAAQQMQMQMQMQQIALQMEQAKVEKLQAERSMTEANAMLTQVRATVEQIKGVYAALQAGGVVATTPGVSPVADEILRSAGWKDATAEQNLEGVAAGMQPGAQGQPQMQGTGPDALPQGGEPVMPEPQQAMGVEPESALLGQNGGIETAQLGAQQ